MVRFVPLIALLWLVSRQACAQDLVAPGAKPEKVATDYLFTEGPAADRDGNVYFTDQPNDRIVKWSAADGKVYCTDAQSSLAAPSYWIGRVDSCAAVVSVSLMSSLSRTF